jgi:hypothetical protein
MFIDLIVAMMINSASLQPANMPAGGENQCWKITQEVRISREIVESPQAWGDQIVITRLQKRKSIPCTSQPQSSSDRG